MPDTPFTPKHIAPCGINCGVCYVHLRQKEACPGCWSDGIKPKHCISCSIKRCEHLADTESELCYECGLFPCRRIRQLDFRYRKNYKISLIANLQQIKQTGMFAFLKKENLKWLCTHCGNITSVHKNNCLHCGEEL